MNSNTIYLDNSATTKPLPEVMQTFLQVNELYYANPASIHEAGVEANALLMRAREQIANIVRTEAKDVIFTAGGTESNNFAIFGTAQANVHKGKHIITTKIEHPSVLEAVKILAQQGFEVDYLSVNEAGVISLDELRSKVRKDTILVSIMHVNNEMGAIQPIQDAAKIIHEQSRAIFHVDAVQSFGKIPVQFNDQNGPDLITISGHKIHALKGSGALIFRKKLTIAPYIVGGGQEFGLRSGTVAVPQAVALAKASRIAVEAMAEKTLQYEKWYKDLHLFLRNFGSNIHLLSSEAGAAHIISFSVKELKGEILINALQKHGIIVSTSSACSSKQTTTSHVVEALNIAPSFKKGVLRLSFGAQTIDAHIEQFKTIFSDIMCDLKGENK
ncbi:cysteine desulfurase family protein [Bacillus ndiopicus]|uniref:cysteine desulfurase family protein n=1 Tax=Bacillus ndiopicus TaxID=1347368 RepID=UPI0005A8F86D|nr:cysteine desulfurase family protein [Bacillus ndiopicus]